ncbi:hypothetical protein J7E62_14790 [Variovorax paradoxus]|nr:hypothetical protein [Variovorax paradoxus]
MGLSEAIGEKRSKFIIFLLAFFSATLSPAAVVVVSGRVANVKGIINSSDIEEIEKSNVETIVFEESLGGTMEAANAYVKLIKARRLNTVVKGRCYSACALSFLAGSSRTVEPGIDNMIMLHVARVLDKKTGELRHSNQNHKVLALIDELTEGKMRDPARSKIAQSWSEAAGVAFIIGPGWWGERINTRYCDGTQGKDTNKCQFLFNADPYDLGILTKSRK